MKDFIKRSIIDSNTLTLGVLNVTDDVKSIGKYNIKTKKLSNYEIYIINETSNDKERMGKLESVSKTIRD